MFNPVKTGGTKIGSVPQNIAGKLSRENSKGNDKPCLYKVFLNLPMMMYNLHCEQAFYPLPHWKIFHKLTFYQTILTLRDPEEQAF